MHDIGTYKKREWIKKIAIIFMIILLVSTFFSNTFMNYSLAKVGTVVVSSKTIEEKIRGSATLESADNYDQIIKDTRTVEFVNVKVGDEVEAGAVLMKLEASDIAELKTAKEELIQLVADCNIALLNVKYENYTKDNQQVAQAREDLQKATLKKERIQTKVINLDSAEKLLDNFKKGVKELRKKLTTADNDVVNYTYLVDFYKGKVENVNSGKDENVVTFYESYKNCKYNYEDAVKKYDLLQEEKETIQKQKKETGYEYLTEANKELTRLNSELNKLYYALTYIENSFAFHDEETAYTYNQYQKDKKIANANIADTINLISQINITISTLTPLENRLTVVNENMTIAKKAVDEDKNLYTQAEREYEEAKSSESGEYYGELQIAAEELEAANEIVNIIKTELEITLEEKEQAQKNVDDYKVAEDKVNEKSAALDEMIANLDNKKLDNNHTVETSDLEILALKDKIELKQKEVDKLTKRQETTEIMAKVAGTISAVNVNSGSTALANTVVCSIKAKGKGYKLSIKVTNEQSKKVKVGDVADVQSYYEGISAVVNAIKSNPEDSANSKIVVFDVVGDNIKLGQSLLVSVGSNSNTYDYVVPSSSVYTDNRGKFVYVVKAKNSALGNKYTVKKVSVKVVASNDTQSAITGDLATNDSVVSSASKPISNGDRVMIKSEE